MRILRYLSLGQNGIYFMDGRNGSVYLWPRGKTVANCITCTMIRACLPYRRFLRSHLDVQCVPKCQVHLPVQGQVFPRDLLGNRTWAEMNTIPEQNSYKACLVSTSSYSSGPPWHWACPDRGCFLSGDPEREDRWSRDTDSLQPVYTLKAKHTFVVGSLWDLRVAQQKAKLTLTAY